MTCQCQVCKDFKRLKNVIMNGDEVQRLEAFNEMFERIEDAETDVAYFKAIHRGVWPSGKAILEHALRKYDDTKS